MMSFFGFGEEPPFGKYLPEQRVAYLGMAIVIGMLVLTGLIKTYKNIYAPDLAHAVVVWTTTLHNLFFVLFILAFVGHIGALILKPNRPMVRGILTGKVRLDYAKHRHPLWIAEMDRHLYLQTAAEKVGGKEPRGTATTAAGAAPAASADEAPSPDAGAAKGIGTDQQKQTEEGAQLSSIEESKNG